MNDAQNTLFQQYKEKEVYSDPQLNIILTAIKAELDSKQLDIVANPAFSAMEMEQVYLGFLAGLSMEEVQLYAKPELSFFQMMEIRSGFLSNLNISDIQKYASSGYSSQQMKQIRLGYQDKLTDAQMNYLLNPNFNEIQLKYLRLGFKHGLKEEGVYLFVGNNFVLEQLEEIQLGFEHRLNMNEILFYAKPENNHMKMHILREAIEKRYTEKELALLSNPALSYKQMQKIVHRIEMGENMENYLEYLDTFNDLVMVKPHLNFYNSNNNLYIGLLYYDEELHMEDHYSDLTVNIEKLPYLYSALDTTYNTENVLKFVSDHGLGEFTGQYLHSGFCRYPIIKFNEEKMQEIDPDMFKAYQKAQGINTLEIENNALKSKIQAAEDRQADSKNMSVHFTLEEKQR